MTIVENEMDLLSNMIRAVKSIESSLKNNSLVDMERLSKILDRLESEEFVSFKKLNGLLINIEHDLKIVKPDQKIVNKFEKEYKKFKELHKKLHSNVKKCKSDIEHSRMDHVKINNILKQLEKDLRDAYAILHGINNEIYDYKTTLYRDIEFYHKRFVHALEVARENIEHARNWKKIVDKDPDDGKALRIMQNYHEVLREIGRDCAELNSSLQSDFRRVGTGGFLGNFIQSLTRIAQNCINLDRLMGNKILGSNSEGRKEYWKLVVEILSEILSNEKSWSSIIDALTDEALRQFTKLPN